jgi:hypothetical protein
MLVAHLGGGELRLDSVSDYLCKPRRKSLITEYYPPLAG